MNAAKIRLSPAEMELVNNADLILTKNAILKKVQGLLEELQVKQQELILLHAAGLPGKVSASSPKISKGENYRGLPYIILDYPRVFEPGNPPDQPAAIFAVRTMFWWGHFFSVTLHLSGIYKQEGEEKLIGSYQSLKEKNFYCCINEDQWAHHFEENNYVLLSELDKEGFEKTIREKSFVKLAKKMDLNQWDEAEEILLGYFRDLMELLNV